MPRTSSSIRNSRNIFVHRSHPCLRSGARMIPFSSRQEQRRFERTYQTQRSNSLIRAISPRDARGGNRQHDTGVLSRRVASQRDNVKPKKLTQRRSEPWKPLCSKNLVDLTAWSSKTFRSLSRRLGTS